MTVARYEKEERQRLQQAGNAGREMIADAVEQSRAEDGVIQAGIADVVFSDGLGLEHRISGSPVHTEMAQIIETVDTHIPGCTGDVLSPLDIHLHQVRLVAGVFRTGQVKNDIHILHGHPQSAGIAQAADRHLDRNTQR